MKTLISIDPGLSTGVIVGTYSDAEPFRVTHAFQFPGGVEGFLENVTAYYSERGWPEDRLEIIHEVYDAQEIGHSIKVVVEKFTARGGGNQGFSYKTRDLEPLRIEGAILALGIAPIWVNPAQQYFMGGKTTPEKLKARNAWLKERKDLGYYLTGKSVGQKDANDARSALSHCISWLRRNKHAPTLELFRKDEDD